MTDTNFDREEVRRVITDPLSVWSWRDRARYPERKPEYCPDTSMIEKNCLMKSRSTIAETDVVAIYTALNQIKPEAFKRPDHRSV